MSDLGAKFKLWISKPGAEGVFGDGKWRLLAAMGKECSLRKAAQALGISYRKAWGDLKKAERHLGVILIEKHRGGIKGGESRLSSAGKAWLAAYSEFRREVEEVVSRSFRVHMGAVMDEEHPRGRLRVEGMLLIGSEGRNAGKTGLACSIIGACPDRRIVGVKVTTVREKEGPCPRGGAGCGACSSFSGAWCITEEMDAAGNKDTARMLAAGAGRVFWLRCRQDHLKEGAMELLERIGPESLIVAESNSLAEAVEPDAFLLVREKGSKESKPSARKVRPLADRIVISDGGRFDFEVGDIMVREGRWRLIDASAVILAGGASSRMASDKGLLSFNGRPLIRHILEQLEGQFREVLVSANDPEKYRFLGVDVVRDREPDQGPLMGIASTLEAAKSRIVFVVACDIPVIDMGFVRRMLSEASRYDCVIPEHGAGRFEPLFAVYGKSALPAIRGLLASGERRIRALFPLVRMKTLDMGDAPWFTNINTIEDYAEFLAHARREAR
jgi:molybdenum cofactor guanylyltransferase